MKNRVIEWKVTDPTCNQMMKILDENRFLFKEDFTHTLINFLKGKKTMPLLLKK